MARPAVPRALIRDSLRPPTKTRSHSVDNQLAAGVATAPAIAGWTEGTDATSLWGRGPNDVWSAGEDIARFDGTRWSRVADAPDAARDLQSVHADSVVTGDAAATWLIGSGPRFFRKAAGAAP